MDDSLFDTASRVSDKGNKSRDTEQQQVYDRLLVASKVVVIIIWIMSVPHICIYLYTYTHIYAI